MKVGFGREKWHLKPKKYVLYNRFFFNLELKN